MTQTEIRDAEDLMNLIRDIRISLQIIENDEGFFDKDQELSQLIVRVDEALKNSDASFTDWLTKLYEKCYSAYTAHFAENWVQNKKKFEVYF